MSVPARILDRIGKQPVFVPFVVTGTSPLMVRLGGSSVDQTGRAVKGVSYSNGDTGLAIWLEPLDPYCIPFT